VNVGALLRKQTFRSRPNYIRLKQNYFLFLTAVRHVVASVPIDLSRHALSVSKILVSQLTSKNDAARDVAVQAFVAMATQCSDVESVSDLVKYLFAVLKGKLKPTAPCLTGSAADSLIPSCSHQRHLLVNFRTTNFHETGCLVFELQF